MSDSGNKSRWKPAAVNLPLLICVLTQLATILLTWEAWQFRTDPVNLGWFGMSASKDAIPDWNFGPLLLLTLLLVPVKPARFGFPIHVATLIFAIAADSIRLQPQVLGITILMAATIYPGWQRISWMYLVSMWGWAGVHKLISPDWRGWISLHLLEPMPVLQSFHAELAVTAAVFECLLALLALVRPRMAVVGCVALHGGIVVLLVVLQWNFSVIPWNVCTMLVGSWLLIEVAGKRANANVPATADRTSDAPITTGTALRRLEWLAIGALLIVPAGFYRGWVPNNLAHVLYSDYFSVATISDPNAAREIMTIERLGVPFPRWPASFKRYFLDQPTHNGDKLCIWRPGYFSRPGYQFFEKRNGRLRELSADQFFAVDRDYAATAEPADGALIGVAPDRQNAMLALINGGAELLKESPEAMVYAIRFSPDTFSPELLEHLVGLPNLVQIQLADCAVDDPMLARIPRLPRLEGIGLSGTRVTDACLAELEKQPRLKWIGTRNTRVSPMAVLQFLAGRGGQ